MLFETIAELELTENFYATVDMSKCSSMMASNSLMICQYNRVLTDRLRK